MSRLNWNSLWDYHEKHEIPRKWWAWDYTLSWLIEPNHPPVMHKIVLFNHLVEDEPPLDAVQQFPWMKPLLRYPLTRGTVADIIDYLSKSGAKLIILDNDFPQFSPDDKKLAEAIHNCSTGKHGPPVPVLMAHTINRTSSSRGMLEEHTRPGGILEELAKLEHVSIEDVEKKYTGTTGITPDEDQVIRRLDVRQSNKHESIVLKALQKIGETVPNNLPDPLDIDFASPPNSDLYPVRPQTYLLDPEKRKQMVSPDHTYRDVTLKGAIVFMGDSVTDVYSTPLTNSGLSEMSGSEILVHSLETIARRSWFTRLDYVAGAVYYLLSVSFGGALLWIYWKSRQRTSDKYFSNLAVSRTLRLMADLAFILFIVFCSYLLACLLFVYGHLIVPVFVPTVSLGFGAVAALMWEREREREDAFHTRVQATEDKLELAKQKYEADLKRQEAEAQSREILMDRQRRKEFVRRINHDLNAPVSVLNWTLSELQEDGTETKNAPEKIARLVKNSDKLCELIDQLVQSYDYETPLESNDMQVCNLADTVADTLDLQTPLANLQGSKLEWTLPQDKLLVKANKLELTRIIDNIVRNALKHNPPRTNVNVQMDSLHGKHHVIVADNGKGIDKEHLSHIFEAGYRVNPEKKDGQGLGLDIVKTLIEKIGGTITVESIVGKGTSFTITMPALEETTSDGNNGVNND
ncbi:MAG: CHASE2 domain-containing protein [Candidatus Obscuribacterales bacterium]|nr:CHASE2 domain-containing protein [Candidatus Obscuribacterales bacterium]